ncbi:MAG: MATE family efflux transporter [Oscillospiraceae bacterium]|nr:MATE family efflux transporter [Oscillospiraceae bacterium]
MNLFVKDKAFYKAVMGIALPMAVQSMISSGVGMLDTIMLGQLGEVAMSASSLANQVGGLFMMINYGLTAGAGVITAQFWGKKDTLSIRKVMSLAYRISIGLALLFSVGATFFPEMLMRIFTTEEAVIADGIRYLRLCGPIYLANAFAITTIAFLRTVGIVNVALVGTVASLGVNLVFNYLLIFGKFGFPKMGIVGAALATVIARMVEQAIVVVYLFKMDSRIGFRAKDFFLSIDRGIWRTFLKHASPVMINEFFWSIGSSTRSIVLGHMGAEADAANSICDIVFQMASFFLWGFSNAASVITGNTIGAGEIKKAKDQAKTFFAISLMLGLFSSVMILSIRGVMIDFYNVSGTTKAMANSILNAMSITCVFQAMGNVNMFGTLRGGGDSRYVLICDVGAMWCLSVPLGFLSGLILKWPVWAVYICLTSSSLFTCCAGLVRLAGGKWAKDVTREKDAVLAENEG